MYEIGTGPAQMLVIVTSCEIRGYDFWGVGRICAEQRKLGKMAGSGAVNCSESAQIALAVNADGIRTYARSRS